MTWNPGENRSRGERHGQAIREGLERLRARGWTLGRPRAFVDLERARELMREGLSIRATAKALRVGDATLRRALAAAPAKRSRKRS
jgi:DNA invertase Pin-like site-specific DNA recombinase